MRKRKTIYCEYQFLKTLPQEQLLDYYKFSNESVIVFDISFEEFKAKITEEEFFKYLLKRCQGGGCELKFGLKSEELKDDCEKGNINSFSPIFLFYQSSKQRKFENKCGQYLRDYGFLAADQSEFLEKCNLKADYGFSIQKGDVGSWKKFLEYKPVYGNSLIIVDNYLLKDKISIEENLKPILNVLLPENLTTKFNISFFTQDSNSSLKQRTESVKRIISELRPELDFTVNFYVDVRHSFHDRVIISNYFWIQCGAGFDLFNSNGKAKHFTTVSFIYPFIVDNIPWAIDAFNYLLDEAGKIVNSAVNNGSVIQYYGENKENRLLKMK